MLAKFGRLSLAIMCCAAALAHATPFEYRVLIGGLRAEAVESVPTAPVDPYAAQTVVFHFDGNTNANGASVATTWANGTSAATAFAPTNPAKFGSSSFATDSNLGCLNITTVSAVDLGAAPFTVEAWIWRRSGSAHHRFLTSTGNLPLFRVTNTNALQLQSGAGSLTAAAIVPTQRWVHVALSRDEFGVFRLFQDGLLVGEASSFVANSVSAFDRIGGYGAGCAEGMPGFIDELRITRGAARYVAPFTPQEAPF